MTKAYLTLSNVAFFILTGMTPIAIKIKDVTQLYLLTKSNPNKEGKEDTNMWLNHWQHHTDTITRILEKKKRNLFKYSLKAVSQRKR